MAQKRIKPKVSLTLDAGLIARVRRLSALLPGNPSLSVIVGEILSVGLPVMEDLAEELAPFRGPDGVVDDDRARDAVAKWAGAQLLGLSDTSAMGGDTLLAPKKRA